MPDPFALAAALLSAPPGPEAELDAEIERLLAAMEREEPGSGQRFVAEFEAEMKRPKGHRP